VDNADDPALEISNLFPLGNRGTILVTTRNPDFRKYETAGAYRVDELNHDDAVALLLKISKIDVDREVKYTKSAEDVVKVLGHLALAIIQVCIIFIV